MDKRDLLLLSITASVLILFATFLALTIYETPSPLPASSLATNADDLSGVDIMYADEDKFPKDLKIQFGLASVSDENYQDRVNYSHLLYRTLRELEEFQNSNNTVVPPVWPSDIDIEKFRSKFNRRSIQKDIEKNVNITTTTQVPVKDVFVKVINAAEPRIEIKLASNNFNDVNITNNSTYGKYKTKINMKEELKLKIEDNKFIISNLTKNVVQFINKMVLLKVHSALSGNKSNIREKTRFAVMDVATENYRLNLRVENFSDAINTL